MSKHDFKNIAKALKTKYGMLPPGWEEELAKPVKKKDGAQGGDAGGGIKLPNNLPKFQKYNQMSKLGLPEATILQAMDRDGVDRAGWVYAP